MSEYHQQAQPQHPQQEQQPYPSSGAPLRITAWRQLRLLLWKNYIRKKRAIGYTLCELIIPLVFMMVLVGMRASWSKTDVPQQLFTSGDYSRSLSTGASQLVHSVACACEQSTESTFGQRANLGWIAFTSSDDTQKDMTQQLMEYVRDTLSTQYTANDTDSCACDGAFKTSYSPLAYIQSTSANGSVGLLHQFPTQSDLNSYISSDEYDSGKVRAVNKAVILQQVGTFANDYQWKYTVSANSSDIPSNSPATDAQVAYSNSTFTQSFYDNGLLTLQFYIDQFIIAKSAQKNASSRDAVPSDYLRKVTIAPMPEPDRVVDSFAANTGSILGLYFLLAFGWPFSRLVKQIVEEKEKKLKEGLAMVGVDTNVYLASWVLLYSIGFTGLILVMTVIIKGALFTNSDFSLLFVFMCCFLLSLLAFAVLLSSIFQSSSIAGLLSSLLLQMTAFPYFTVWHSGVSSARKQSVCVLPATSFALGIVKIADLDSIGSGANWKNLADESYNFSVGTSIMWMLIDTAILSVLAWYLEKVIPKQYGTHLPWYFLLTKSYWCPGSGEDSNTEDAGLGTPLNRMKDVNVDKEVRYIEPVPSSLLSKVGVRIRNLTKHFSTSQTSTSIITSLFASKQDKKKQLTAVNGLDLDLHIGQLFVLLGHNGAGKTTTINMLTGMYPPSSGTANVFGLDIRSDMNRIRQNLGVCPQHSVVWDELTVEEHLLLFGGLKGLEGPSLQNAVNIAIAEVTLEEKRHQPSKSLSGGQNRRLCLAMALIGDSKVVFLDEPTSGVDPHSRRAIWNLLHQKKHDRIIILTTHFMDEADELADRIAILSKGKIKCCGSSLYLKKQWGVGYSMTLTRASAERDSHLLQQHDGGDEEKDDALVSSKKGGKIVWDPSAITTLLKSHIEGAEKLSQSGGELCFRLPLGTAGKALPTLLTYFDENKEKMGIGAYGLSVTTLEDVFLQVAREDEESNNPLTSYQSNADSSLLSTLIADPNDVTFLRQFHALLTKRKLISKRDTKGLFCQVLLPIIILIIGMMSVGSYQSSPAEPIHLSMSGEFNTPNRVYVNPDVNSFIVQSFTSHTSEGVLQTLETNSYADFAQQMFSLRDSQREAHYGAYYGSSGTATNEYTAVVNISAIYGQPTFVNAGNTAILRGVTQNQQADISVSYAAFDSTTMENQVDQVAAGTFISLIISLAFSFIPTAYCIFIVMEREMGAKHLQFISGVSSVVYWVSNLVWDLIMYTIPACASVLILLAESNPNFKGSNTGVVILTLVTYGTSIIPFTYLTSFLFKSNPSRTNLFLQNLMILVFLLAGIGSTFITFILYLKAPHLADALRHVLRPLPGFCLGDTLFYLNVRTVDTSKGGSSGGAGILSQWDLNISGWNFVYMSIESVVYFTLVLMVEDGTFEKLKKHFFTKGSSSESAESLLPQKYASDQHGVQIDPAAEEDSDVLAERTQMQNSHTSNDALIQLHGLRKVYPRTQKNQTADKIALQNLYFSVRAGEIFGFLGQNGAGKTTALKILTGDLQATSGHAILHRYDLREDAHEVRRFVGYCPQFDALHLNLTGAETLEFYARIRGIPERNIPIMVNYLIDRLGFRTNAIQPVQGYSGGTKRKVSVGVALIGSPPIVFLDEPSTGMDPMSRRFLWNFISETMAECAVILTTHSMEEAEALSNRIGILNAGALQCLGTSQHLKSRFGRGQKIDVRCSPSSADAVRAFLTQVFPHSRELENFEGHIKIHTASNVSLPLASIFSLIEENRERLEILDYSVGQVSLEDVFLQLAAKHNGGDNGLEGDETSDQV